MQNFVQDTMPTGPGYKKQLDRLRDDTPHTLLIIMGVTITSIHAKTILFIYPALLNFMYVM